MEDQGIHVLFRMSRMHTITPSIMICVLGAILMPESHGKAVLPDDCTVTQDAITCNSSLPEYVPENITEVHIRQYGEFNIEVGRLSDPSWTNVTKLDIIADTGLTILPYNFVHLKNLRSLGIHDDDVYLSPHSFSSLPSLFHLDLSNCTFLSAEAVYLAIKDSGNTLRNLTSLNLDYLYSENKRVVKLENILIILKLLHIEFLSLRWTNILYSNYDTSWEFQSSLKTLDISGAILLANTLDDLTTAFVYTLSRIETLYLSDIDFSYLHPSTFIVAENEVQTPKGEDCLLTNWVFNQIKVIESNRISSVNFIIDNFVFDLSHCDNVSSSLTKLHFSQNRIRKLNATLIMLKSVLNELDVSSNSMYYLSPNFLQDMSYLGTLILSDNDLGEMQHMPEFEHLFSKQLLLRCLYLSNNRLSRLPRAMFASNTKLQLLDLSRNNLETISFSTENLTVLETLRLQDNNIFFFDTYSMLQIDSLLVNNMHTNVSVVLYNNPLQCSCESIQFLHWYVYDFKPTIKGSISFMCHLDDEYTDIDQSAIDRSKQLCKSNILTVEFYILLLVYILAIVALLLLVLRCIYVRLQKNRLMKQRHVFIQTIRARKIQEKHLIFLSENCDTCDELEEQISLYVIKNIKEGLTQEVGNDFCVLKSDNINGQLGVYRDEAASKFIVDSCVVVMLVSITDPDNRYFRTDFELAKFHNKPVILLSPKFKDKHNLPVEYCHMYPMVELVLRDGAWQTSTGWKNFCVSILDMAVTGRGDRRLLHP